MGLAVRRLLSRHRWVYWLVVATIATIVAASVRSVITDAEHARDAWTTTTVVLTAARDHDAGEPIDYDSVELPMVAVPAGALQMLTGDEFARQPIMAGEVLTTIDIAADTAGVAAAGSLTIAIRSYDPSTARVGDSVHILAEGRSLSSAGVVVEVTDAVVHVAVPERDAPAVALASNNGTATIAVAP
ncbi:MAG: hypothetical protein AAGF73_09705 [Actinomycetota bacterium]